MKAFLLFTPRFKEWPLAIVRELHANDPASSFGGLVTGSRTVYKRVASHREPAITPIDFLDDLERSWLETPDPLPRLEVHDRRLGARVLRQIVTADRQVGNGLVTGGRMRPTRLAELCRDTEAIRRYVAGLLDWSFATLEAQRPDLVFCYVVAGGVPFALAAVACHLGIPFARLTTARVGDHHVVDDSPEGLMLPVRRLMARAERDPGLVADHLAEARKFLASSRLEAATGVFSVHGRAAFAERIAPRSILRRLRAELAEARKGPWGDQTKYLRVATPLGRLRHELSRSLRARRLMAGGTFPAPNAALPAAPFAFFPLHVDPEQSTMVQAPMHTDQLAVLEALSKSLPLGMDLIVKEHVPMLGLRPAGYYERIAALPGARFVSPFANSRELIRNAAVSVVITGTAAWEAMIQGRPTVVIGDSPYTAVGEGFVQCSNLSRLGEAVDRARAAAPADDRRLELYLACIHALSFEFPEAIYWGSVGVETPRRHRAIAVAITERLERFVREATHGRGGVPRR